MASGAGQSIPGMLTMFMIMTVLIGGTQSLTAEKLHGTLSRLATTPMSRGEIIMGKLKPLGVLVVLEAEHLCMSMRGVKKPGITTTTSAVRGIFKDDEKTRAEALALIGR